MDVVSHPGKYRMGADADDQVKIARRAAVRSRVAFALQTDALAVAGPGLDAELHRFGAFHHTLAVARRAVVGDAAGPVAARAGDVELHPPAHLRHVAGT